MSSDTEGLTELEISSGCRWSMLDSDSDEFDGYLDKARPKRNSANNGVRDEAVIGADRLAKGARFIAGLTDTTQIQRRLIYQLLLENSESAMSRYLFKEDVPAIYQALVTSDDCIETLVRGILYKVCRIPRSVDLDMEIAALRKL